MLGQPIPDTSPLSPSAIKRQQFHELLAARRSSPNPDEASLLGTRSVEKSSTAVATIPRPAGISGPWIFAKEYLPSGEFMIAWEGSVDRLYDVEYSDDLQRWPPGVINLPALNGIGTWTNTSSSPKRFFRVIEHEETIIPSDPTGGNRTTTFGGSIAITLLYDHPRYIDVTPRLPDDIEPSVFVACIDGVRHANCYKIGNGVYRTTISSTSLSIGPHSCYAVINPH